MVVKAHFGEFLDGTQVITKVERKLHFEISFSAFGEIIYHPIIVLSLSLLLHDHFYIYMQQYQKLVLSGTRNLIKSKSELHLCLIGHILAFANEENRPSKETLTTLNLTRRANRLSSLSEKLYCTKCPFPFQR